MSKIEKLIEELCPNGVEYKKLEFCCRILDNKRKPISKNSRNIGIYPYYGANGIQDYIDNYIFDGKYVLIGEDGSVQTQNGNPIVNWAEGKIWVNNHAHIIEEANNVLLRYLFHYLQIVDVSDLIHGNIPKLTGSDFRNIIVPVPPLEVQEEIVRILDKFGELEAELEARKSQYEFWRGKLLNNNESNVINIQDISNKVFSGKCYDKISEGLYPVYGSTGIIGYNNDYLYDEDKILIARVGANAGYVSIAHGKYNVTDNALILELKDNINLKYVYYYLKDYNLNSLAKGGGQPLITGKQIKELTIFIPSLQEQERIVNILDKFDKLVNDISEGLPAEIEARRKQYAYYRNKLLSFEELVVNE